MNDNENPMAKWIVLLLLGFLAAGVVGAAFVYLQSARPEDAPGPSGFAMARSEAEQRRAISDFPRRAVLGSASPNNGSNMMKSVGGEQALPSVAAPADSAFSQLRNSSGVSQPVPLQGAEQKPSPEEERILSGVVGKWDAKTASGIGSERGLAYRVGEKLFQYPKVLGFVVNNPLVIQGVLSQERVKRNCTNGQALRSFLSDGKSIDGVSRGLQVLQESTRYPGATKVFLESDMAKALLGPQCPAADALRRDPNALAAVMSANPKVGAALGNPDVLRAVNAGKDATQLYNNLQQLQGQLGTNGH